MHGCSTDGAQDTLRLFEATLAALEEHERSLGEVIDAALDLLALAHS
jgi:hypothetical protein